MATSFLIPLVPSPQRLSVNLNGVRYRLRLRWLQTTMGGWVMDINDSGDHPLICGIPLVTGCDLLEQYRYIIPVGSLYVWTDGNPPATPTFENLGSDSNLYYWI